MVPEISNPDIRERLFKRYRIVYRVMKKAVEGLTVFEGHRLLRIDELDASAVHHRQEMPPETKPLNEKTSCLSAEAVL